MIYVQYAVMPLAEHGQILMTVSVHIKKSHEIELFDFSGTENALSYDSFNEKL